MRIDFNISQTEAGKFRTACEAAIRNVGAGTKAATELAAWEIMSESLGQVPVDTGTLISSAFLGVSRRTDIGSYRYGAILGYGDPEYLSTAVDFGPIDWHMEPSNNINPKSGLQASTYAARVHEDLDMPHPNGGKAKFLEDPMRNWAAGRFARTAMQYWSMAIGWSNESRFIPTRYRNRDNIRYKYFKFKTMTSNWVNRGSSTQRGGEYVRKGDSK